VNNNSIESFLFSLFRDCIESAPLIRNITAFDEPSTAGGPLNIMQYIPALRKPYLVVQPIAMTRTTLLAPKERLTVCLRMVAHQRLKKHLTKPKQLKSQSAMLSGVALN